MSSLVRRMQVRRMKASGAESDYSRPRWRNGEIVGWCFPLPSGSRPPEIVRSKFGTQPTARGSRRGKRNAAYIERRQAASKE